MTARTPVGQRTARRRGRARNRVCRGTRRDADWVGAMSAAGTVPRHVGRPRGRPPRAPSRPPSARTRSWRSTSTATGLTFEMKCEGLDAEQLARRSVPPSTMSLLGLVRHLAGVEHYWFRRVARGPDGPAPALPDRGGPRPRLQRRRRRPTRCRRGVGVVAAARSRHAREVLRRHDDLGATCRRPTASRPRCATSSST